MQLAVVALGEPARSRSSARLSIENGEHGASAMRICAPGFGSWNSFSTRSLSARISSSSCTTLSGGRPPSFCDRFIEPRVIVMRMPSVARRLGLDVDGVLEPLGKEIMMIGRRRAAGEHQFGQREPRRESQVLGRQPRPDRIERLQPGKQLLVDRGGMGAGQRLEEVVMGVDEAGQHDMAAGVENRVDGRRTARGPCATSSTILRSLDDEAAPAPPENRQRVS